MEIIRKDPGSARGCAGRIVGIKDTKKGTVLRVPFEKVRLFTDYDSIKVRAWPILLARPVLPIRCM